MKRQYLADKTNLLKIFSFFSGSGLLDLGFEMNGYKVELVNEFSKEFIGAHQYSREQMGLPSPKYGYYNTDINDFFGKYAAELKLCMKEIRQKGEFVGFIGGPPCPDFSVAGKQRGRNGTNGQLSLSYIKLIIEYRPDFFLFENVKGLYRTAKHRIFYEELKSSLRDADYLMSERLTNALEFGTPQDRDRILLFGVNKRLLMPKKTGSIDDFPWTKYIVHDIDEITKVKWPSTNPFKEMGFIDCPTNVPLELTVQYWFDKNSVEIHKNAGDCLVPRSGLSKMMTVAEGDDSKKSYKRLHRWRYSPTVAYGNNEVHLHPYKARRLSVAEALALQSLPKEFVLPPEMSLTAKYKTIGNGVPYMLANGIARTIADYLNEAIIL